MRGSLGDRLIDEGDRAFALARVAERVGRRRDHVAPRPVRELGGIRHLVPQFEHALAHASGGAERVGAPRVHHRGE